MVKTSEFNGKALNPTPNTPQDAPETVSSLSGDFSHALTSARIACYDDFRSAPRITEIAPNTTAEFIEDLASTVYAQAQQTGGAIPYTVIREVSENFIHARFCEIVVSIYDGGNTIRFSDQGPGIPQKKKTQMPGFSSATDPMKQYIRGVGSGLPLVKEYLSFSHGRITIEDNLRTGGGCHHKRCTRTRPGPFETSCKRASVQQLGPAPHRSRERHPIPPYEGRVSWAHGYQKRPQSEPQHRTQNPQKP